MSDGSCRFLYLVGQLGPGGLERQLFYLLRSMDRERYRPAVMVWNFSREDMYVSRIRNLGVPIHMLSEGSRTAKLAALRQMVRRLSPEVVHSYTFFTNFAAYWSAYGTRSLPVGSIRSSFEHAKKGTGLFLGSLSARFPRVQVCNSFSAEQEVRTAKGPFVPGQLRVVSNGIDLERFSYTPPRVNGPAKIVGVGSLFSVKRWDRLIDAAHLMKKAGLKFQVQIIGEGPLRGELQVRLNRLELSEWVDLLGRRTDVPDLLADASFLAHTSDSEGCPNAVMEAMACGRAVIAQDVGDIPWLVEDGETGFVVPQGDQALLIDRLVCLLKDPMLCRRMGERGRAKAERLFKLERLVSETLEVYRQAGWKDE